MGTNYYFIPYFRSGLSAHLSEDPGNKERAELPINLIFNAQTKSGGVESKSVQKKIQLYGPGDIAGINNQIILDQDPKDGISDFEPNYFPTIQFRDPDFPWRYNAGAANGHKLLPWISLIVLVAEDRDDAVREFSEPEYLTEAVTAEQQQLPYIEDVNTLSLPDINESWRWAHVQISGSENFNGVDDVKNIIQNTPEHITSRLLCARRLHPGVLYNAFLVPNFKLGFRPAGIPIDGAGALEPAWTVQSNETIRLPYYYRWEFRTGERGDFEHLVRLLEARELTSVGKRELDCSNPGMGIQGIERVGVKPDQVTKLELEGAVQSIDMEPTIWGKDRGAGDNHTEIFQEALMLILNRNQAYLEEQIIKIPDVQASFAISNGKIIVAQKTAMISLQTSVISTLRIRYGRGNIDEEIEVTNGSRDHSVAIENLDLAAIYFIRIEATSSVGEFAETIILEFQTPGLPHVAPPTYGRWHAKRTFVESSPAEKGWLDELNLDPRHRSAAGVGAEVIRRHQEEFMALAWEQVGEIDQANAMISQAQLGLEVTGNIFKRLEDLPNDLFFAQTTKLQGRVKEAGFNSSVETVIRNSRVPLAALKGNMRRIRRPHGPIHKRQARATGQMQPLMNRQIIELFNGKASQQPEEVFRAGGNELIPNGTISFTKVSNKFDEKFIDPNLNNRAMPNSNGMVMAMNNLSSELILSRIDEGEMPDLENGAFAKEMTGFLDEALLRSDSTLEIDYPLDVPALRDRFTQKINPRETIPSNILARLRIGEKPLERMPERIMAAPKIPVPMSQRLEAVSSEWLVPGIANIPQNTISLLRTNRRFIEAFLCGCNHEFAAELLWREYPTDQRGTFFRQFWQPIESYEKIQKARTELAQQVSYQVLNTEEEREEMLRAYLEEIGYFENQKDISPIHMWSDDNLGENDQKPKQPGDENLVLLIRGDLLRKYPNAVIYAIPGIKFQVGFSNVVLPGLEEYLSLEEYASYTESVTRPDPKTPIFSASIEPDITLLGFDVTVNDIIKNEWFFVIEERVSETRFGLDVPSGEIINSQVNFYKNLSWDHFPSAEVDEQGKYINGIPPTENISNINSHDLWEMAGSASIARITFQKPVRIVISSNKMIPENLQERFKTNSGNG